VALTLLTLVCFQQMSLIGRGEPACDPLITLVVTPLALLGSRRRCDGRRVVRSCSANCWAGWRRHRPSVWSVAVAPWWAQAAGLFAAAWRSALAVAVRALAVPLLFPLLLPARDLRLSASSNSWLQTWGRAPQSSP
jgi:hypothetical protein